jgi:hypothetical protein
VLAGLLAAPVLALAAGCVPDERGGASGAVPDEHGGASGAVPAHLFRMRAAPAAPVTADALRGGGGGAFGAVVDALPPLPRLLGTFEGAGGDVALFPGKEAREGDRIGPWHVEEIDEGGARVSWEERTFYIPVGGRPREVAGATGIRIDPEAGGAR